MSELATFQPVSATSYSFKPAVSGSLQRACACGQHTGSGGECDECRKKSQGMLQRASIQSPASSPGNSIFGVIQTKLAINRAGDEYEQEADGITSQVMSTPLHPSVRPAPPSIRRLSLQPVGQGNTAPESVDQALASPGSPLELSIRQDMERRFGYDFSQVRVHSDAAAGQSAQAVNALAYTAGHDIVFGSEQYNPGSYQGAKLLAHELAHVVQRSGAEPSGLVNSQTNAQSRGPQPKPITGMIARQTKSGTPEKNAPNDKSKNKPFLLVDKDGKIIESLLDDKGYLVSLIDKILRVPVKGLKGGYDKDDEVDEFHGQGQITAESAKENAVALVPLNVVYQLALNQKDKSEKGSVSDKVPVDVLLHFHGFGIGYRQLLDDKVKQKKDFAGILKPDERRDINLYQMEQQIHTVAQNRLIIAILPQGSQRSKFGKAPSQKSDDYIKEVFDKLKEQHILPTNATPGQLIVSAHSGGGGAAMETANQASRAGKRTDVLLFDAINSSCEKEEVIGKDGKKVNLCKSPLKCNTQYYQVESWVTKKMDEDFRSLSSVAKKNQLETLKNNGTRFRGYTTQVLSSEYSCTYGYWYYKLNEYINKKIDSYKLPADVRAQLLENYQVKSVGGNHERILGPHNLEKALKE